MLKMKPSQQNKCKQYFTNYCIRVKIDYHYLSESHKIKFPAKFTFSAPTLLYKAGRDFYLQITIIKRFCFVTLKTINLYMVPPPPPMFWLLEYQGWSLTHFALRQLLKQEVNEIYLFRSLIGAHLWRESRAQFELSE